MDSTQSTRSNDSNDETNKIYLKIILINHIRVCHLEIRSLNTIP